MVDVKNKTCIHEGCKTYPAYNKEGETKRLYCSIHKLDGMVNVISKTCIHEGCKTLPTYNIDGQRKPLYCASHKLEGMVNVMSKTCIHEGCKTLPTYNIDGETGGLYCNKHKLDDMIDIKHKTCKSEWCSTRPIEKYDGYCRYCYMNLFPDKPVSRNYKTKEHSVVEFVTTKFPDFTWVADKHVSGGCSKRRPDLLLDLGDQIIIVEIDENQHTDYNCSCENKRIMELSQDVGHRPIVFIRFNPDDYIDENGKNISSCWGQDGNGICVIKKSKKVEWETRLQQLNYQIQYWSNASHRTNKTVEVVQLFYDMNLDEDE
jgi:nitrite reductase/ring-hydroxylating ferredoxin subunit